uniref:(California timema) hypothetical protein n=1 Tax=Timema californicum TaxID=61474 RepID=A0A7R9IYH9_TIMCA|nr:unnamed protein product [Timema californicum]
MQHVSTGIHQEIVRTLQHVHVGIHQEIVRTLQHVHAGIHQGIVRTLQRAPASCKPRDGTESFTADLPVIGDYYLMARLALEIRQLVMTFEDLQTKKKEPRELPPLKEPRQPPQKAPMETSKTIPIKPTLATPMEPSKTTTTKTPEPTEPYNPDSFNNEFVYYSTTLKHLAPSLTREEDRRTVIPWVKKLFGPEYHSPRFKGKRNRYLLSLILSLLNDELYGVFSNVPPKGALPDVGGLVKPVTPKAAWEEDSHKCEMADERISKFLDEEFQLLLYLARPYAALLVCSQDKTKVASWLQTLCAVGPKACIFMKGIRNDYMKALLGYVSELRVVGPFQGYPPQETLLSIHVAAKSAAQKRPFTDPTTKEANDFLRSQPVPENGAFCYVAITGNVEDSNILEPSGSNAFDASDEALTDPQISDIMFSHGLTSHNRPHRR